MPPATENREKIDTSPNTDLYIIEKNVKYPILVGHTKDRFIHLDVVYRGRDSEGNAIVEINGVKYALDLPLPHRVSSEVSLGNGLSINALGFTPFQRDNYNSLVFQIGKSY